MPLKGLRRFYRCFKGWISGYLIGGVTSNSLRRASASCRFAKLWEWPTIHWRDGGALGL